MSNYIKCSQFLANNVYKIIDGKTFNEHCKDEKFKKIINEDYTSGINDFQYKIGLNTDTNKLTTNTCSKGGLYFTTEENIKKFLNYGSIIVDVKIPNETQVFIEEKN
jgi:hypothetical protein